MNNILGGYTVSNARGFCELEAWILE